MEQDLLGTEPSKDDYERFEHALRGLYDSKGVGEHWWGIFILEVKRRRMMFMEQLSSESLEPKLEERLRGRINELAFIIALDQLGQRLATEARDGRRKESESRL